MIASLRTRNLWSHEKDPANERKQRWTLYIDGQPGPVVGEEIPPNANAVSFTGNGTVRAIGILNGEVVKHTVSL